MILETDASGYGIGAVLHQSQDDKEVPIAYFSKSLNDAQKNYDTYKLELYALLKAVQYLQIYWAALALSHALLICDHTIQTYWCTMNL